MRYMYAVKMVPLQYFLTSAAGGRGLSHLGRCSQYWNRYIKYSLSYRAISQAYILRLIYLEAGCEQH